MFAILDLTYVSYTRFVLEEKAKKVRMKIMEETFMKKKSVVILGLVATMAASSVMAGCGNK